jgi:hypothetical protein
VWAHPSEEAASVLLRHDTDGPSPLGIDYLQQIFTRAVGHDDPEHLRERLFAPGRLRDPHLSMNQLVSRRIRYLDDGAPAAGPGAGNESPVNLPASG